MWHIKNAVVFSCKAKIIIEMREKLLTRGGVYILQKGHKKTKNWPSIDYLFSRNYSSIEKLLSFQEKKIINFFLLSKGVQGKRSKNYYQSAFLLYWYAKTIMKLL